MRPTRRKPARWLRSAGFVIPIAVFVLVFFAILGITMMFSGTADYSHSARVYYGTKADLVARAVHEEALMVLFEAFSRPLTLKGEGGMWGDVFRQRQELLAQVRSSVAPEGSGESVLRLERGPGALQFEERIEIGHS